MTRSTLHGITPLFSSLLCALCLLLAASSSAAPPDSPYGINGCGWSHLGANTGTFNREAGAQRLAALKRAGVKWDRCDFWWDRIEPEKGRFVWADYDHVVQQYRAAGIQVMPILCYASAWSPKKSPTDDAERQLFARFVFETVARYKKDVRVWEIWNEPNITPYWVPDPDPKAYAALLKTAYAAAKRADPTCTVVGGVTAGVDFAYVEQLLQLGAFDSLDVLSVHPYQGNLGSVSPDKGGLASSLRGLQTLLAEYGVRKPIFVTEIGHRTTGSVGDTTISDAQQAAYLVRSFVLAQSAGAQRVFWFNLQDWDEYWGILTQTFQEKPSFRTYQTMTRHLEGKRPAGTLKLADRVEAHAFTTTSEKPTSNNTVVVVWSPDDADRTLSVRARKIERADGINLSTHQPFTVGLSPTFITGIDPKHLAALQPLPAPPPLAKTRPTAPKSPPLPPTPAEWHLPAVTTRLPVVVATASPPDRPTPVIIPAGQLPRSLRSSRTFTAFSSTASFPAQRDLDGNVLLVLPPAKDAAPRTLYLYPSPLSPSPSLSATDAALSNTLLTLHFTDKKFARHVQLKSGYTSKSDQVDGLFAASYQDSDDAWPRTDASAEVRSHTHTTGPVAAQYRSKLTFGKNKAEYEFTFTLFAADPSRIAYTGTWLSPGTALPSTLPSPHPPTSSPAPRAAVKQVNLGDSYPDGSLVVGLYGQTTLPAAGISFPKVAVVRPADSPSVTAVLVSPGGKLQVPGWATRSLVGAGLLHTTQFPATVNADYFWYESPPSTDLQQIARSHWRAGMFPPAITVGAVEQRR